MLFQSYVGKGLVKPTSWDVRKISQYPLVVDDGEMQDLWKQKFVVMTYNQSITAESVDDVRLNMFAQKQRPRETIPSAREAWTSIWSMLLGWCVAGVGQQ